MQVETYEVIDIVANSEMQELAMEGETAMLIESLGLDGQKELVTSIKGDSIFNPYRAMTQEEHFVFSTLFPKITEVTAYKDGPIPLRVLQVISHVRQLNNEDMGYIGVMHPENWQDDPVLFAQKTRYSGTRYLLARWGTALLPFSELREQAIIRKAESAKTNFNRIIKECQSALNSLDDYVREEINKGGDAVPYFSL